jgi:hypothetical protein
MPKVFNRATQVGGEDHKVGTPVVTVLDFDADGFVTRAKGKTLPTDGDKGYAKGCEFTRLTGSLVGNTGPRKYTNLGTEVKAKFVPVTMRDRQTFEEFRAIPTVVKNDGYSTPTGSTGDTNVLITDQNKFEYHVKGTQTILAPVFSANGLDIGMDQTDNDGVELSQGITARSKSAFTVGTDPGFYFTVQFSIEDVSGTDDCAIGFRKAEAYQANVDDYDEMAALNVISGDIKIETILNNAATTTTDTTQDWADAATHTLTVKVNTDRTVTYEVDSAAPTATAQFSFDSGEVVVPFFFMLNASDVVGAVNVKKWEVGYL